MELTCDSLAFGYAHLYVLRAATVRVRQGVAQAGHYSAGLRLMA